MTKVAQRHDREFEDEIGAMFDATEGMIVRLRVTDVGRLKLARANGDVIGDIDVLAADTQRRVVYAVDTKHLAVARTPIEVARELRGTFKTEGRTADIDRHLERAAWLDAHLADCLAWLRIDGDARTWRVEPLIVVDVEVLAAFIEELPMQVLDPYALEELLTRA